MGTSTSSKGPESGVPFDPPWLDNAGGNDGTDQDDNENSDETDSDKNPGDSSIPGKKPSPNMELAPTGRFKNARTSLGKYAKEGDNAYLRKALGHYSKTGMGGASRLANRMQKTTKTAASIVKLLSSPSSTSNTEEKQWFTNLYNSDASARDVINEIVKRLLPESGGLEENSCSDSIAKALSEFIEINDDADLAHLNESEIKDIVESFLSYEAYNRLMQDMGQLFERSKITPTQSVHLRNEIREYLKSELSRQLDKLWDTTKNPSQAQLNQIMKLTIENSFKVYEDEL